MKISTQTTRGDILKLATECRILAREEFEGETNAIENALTQAADILSTPLWFSLDDFLICAEAMQLLHLSIADAWTVRQRLDEFRQCAIVVNGENFAAYLNSLTNGGVQ